MEGDIFTLDSDNNAAVRTVSVNAGAAETNSPVIFTKDENGNAAVRVTGTGGGGGGIDESRTIVKSDTIPTADEESLGKVYMYTGETNATYTHGYIYECMPTYSDTAVVFGSANITWALADFVAWLENAGVPYERATHGTMTYAADGDLWTVLGIDDKGMPVFTWSEYTQDLIDAGCVFGTTPVAGDSSTFTFTTEIDGYVWVRRDVQPSGAGSVNSVNGKSGIVVLDAEDVGALPDTTTAADIGGMPELSALPTAGSSNEGLIVLYSGATDATYTNGYVYKCVEDSETPGTYLWTRIDVQPHQTINYPVTSVNTKTGAVVLDAEDVGAQAATAIVTISSATATQALAGNTIYNCGEMTSLEITLPATPTIDFIAQLNFTSGTTATALTAPAGMVWLGNDIVQGVFVPVASKRYAVLFFYDGANVRGLVQGV